MKKLIVSSLMIFLLLLSSSIGAQNRLVQFSEILPEFENSLSTLSNNIDAFDNLLNAMNSSGKANENYSLKKNIFLSSVLAISTIKAICEYENDLMTLFIDLSEKNREKFFDVRIESIEIALRQINTMHKQIRINYSLLPINFFEKKLVREEQLMIENTSDLLNRMIVLLKSVNHK